ncbi:MAG: reverse transcriptase/maturase family protein [Patescibacteria group bacterium]|nr:reverse transcriptase/maturase family protein [Patescibacteria group bacterium]MDD4304528.1 reverse transcriptase/maturase family protein [Patescibacteria group bacterium]MDD4695636.1 reverse transcriptase/maturase family protein [Patescibacteria group bacterium]
MFDKIVSFSNLRSAYLDIVEKFIVDCKNLKYHGLDNLFIQDIDLDSKNIIDICQKELLEKKEIDPALLVSIPKKNNPEKYRDIFIYNIKDRIKAQAIYNILLPEFEKIFSDRLFSYRPGKPPYLASKNFCHRYRKNFLSDYVLILDLENYSDKIDKNILYSQLQKIFDDEKVLDLLKLFIFNKIYKNGKIELSKNGLVQGVPLIALFTNLYLTDIDHKYKNKSPFYIRIGDDIGIFDKNIEKLNQIKLEILEDLENRKLLVNNNKLFIGSAKEKFSFLGYSFYNGCISLEDAYIKRIESSWKNFLKYKHLDMKKKMSFLKRVMNNENRNFNYQFQKIVKDKSQINNSEQIKKMSENFFYILTNFFYEKYSYRNRRLLEKKIKNFKIVSLYNFYSKFHYGRNKRTN